MTGELINMDGIGTVLMSISDKLGITLVQMYEIYYRAQFTMAVIQIVFILIWCIIVSYILYYVYKVRSETDRSRLNDLPLGVEMLIITAIVGAVSGILLLLLYDPVVAIFCPDYTALRSLMSDVCNIMKAVK